MKFFRKIPLFFIAILMVACSTAPNNAPVIDRNDLVAVNKTVIATPKVNSSVVNEARNTYIVKRGDTLYRIALDHGQNYRDIVAWNNLKNPNDIKVDQVLKVSLGEVSVGQGLSENTSTYIETKNLSPTAIVSNKSSPKGEKRPYSELNLAELQKGDTPVVILASVAGLTQNKVEVPIKLADKSNERAIIASNEAENISWMWPTEGKVSAVFDDVKNKGLDIPGKSGQEVYAAAAGKVMYEGSSIRGYGNLVIIKHNNNFLSAYAHNKTNLVKEGQVISKGQKIAEMGNTDTDIVKLHFEIRQQGKPVDPLKFLPGR